MPGPIMRTIPASGGGGFTQHGVLFAGDSACWLERGGALTGAADNKMFTFIANINLTAGDASARRVFQGEDGRIRATIENDDHLRLTLESTAGATLVDIESTSSLVAAGGNYLVQISVDKSVETRRHFYINGVDVLQVNTFLSDDVDGNTASIDWTQGDWAIGDFVGGGAGALAACVTGLFMTNAYYNFSDSAVRTAKNLTTDLTADSPLIYMKDPFSTYTVNSGTGGNFTKQGATAFTSCTGI